MANFIKKQSLFDLIDSSAFQTKKLIDNFDDAFNKIDWGSSIEMFNERRNEILSKGKEFMNEINSFLGQVKKNANDFKVTVKFDKDSGEKLLYKVDKETRLLVVKVKFDGENQKRSNSTEVLIPEGFSLEGFTIKRDKEEKTAVFSFKAEKEDDEDDDSLFSEENFDDENNEQIAAEQQDEQQNDQRFEMNEEGVFVRRDPEQ